MKKLFDKKQIFLLVVLFINALNAIAQPAIIVHPDDVSTCSGNTITFEVITSNVTYYQWQEHDGTGWFDIDDSFAYASGQNTPTLTISDAIFGLNAYKYRCKVEDNEGNSLISDEATLTVWESPMVITNPQDTETCKGEIVSFSVTADFTTNYQWQENRGTGWDDLEDNVFYNGVNTSTISIYTIFGIDDYLYRCVVGNNHCEETSEIAVLTVYPAPQVFYTLGGGSICEDSDGVEISLNDSDSDILYILFRDGENTGTTASGTGSALSFGIHYIEGTYTIEAYDSEYGCTTDMEGEAVITHNSLPQSFEVSGDGILCSGGVGSSITLSGSENGTIYKLLLNGTPTGIQIEGTGEALQFPNINTTGLYTVEAVSENECSSIMTGSVEVIEYAIPTPFNITGGGYICPGIGDISIFLENSEENIIYTLILNGNPTSTTVTGTGNQIEFEGISVAGEYTIEGTNPESGCSNMMSSTVSIENSPLPEAYTVIGGGAFCSGLEGMPILLSQSQESCYYEVYRNNETTGSIVDGTGNQLSLGIYDQAGSYSVKARFYDSGCESWMSNSVDITINPTPIANAGPDIAITQGTNTTLQGSATGTNNPCSYNWSPQDLLNDNTISAPTTVPMYASQVFTLVVTDQITNCNSNADTVVVQVGGGDLSVEASANNETICAGESVQLFALASGGTGLYQYSWTSEPEGFNSDQVNPIVNPEVETTYTISLNDGLNTIESEITIYINDIPTVYNLSGSGTYCNGDESIHINMDGSESDVIYTLYKNNVSTGIEYEGTGEEMNFYDLSGSGVYSIEGKKTIGECTTQMNGIVEIEIVPRPVAYAGGQYTGLTGNSVNLYGTAFGYSGDYTAQWQPAEMLSNPNSLHTQTESLFTSTFFTLTVTDMETGCESIPDTAIVNIAGNNDQLLLSVTASIDTICEGDPVNLLGIATGGTGDYSYAWSSNPSGFSNTVSNPTVFPSISTWYYLTLNDGINSVTDSIEIIVQPAPLQQTLSGGGSYCSGSGGLEVILDGSEEGVLYELLFNSFSTGNIISGTGSSISFANQTEEGAYSVKAFRDNIPCETIMESYIYISEDMLPIALVSGNITIEGGQSAQVSSVASGGSGFYNYEWAPEDLFVNPTLQNAQTIPLTTSTIVTLTVTDQNTGCESIPDSVLITVVGGNITAEAWSNTSEICDGEEAQLFIVASGGTGNYSYSWSSIPEGFTSNLYNPIVNPHQTTTYFVHIEDDANHTEDYELEVVVHPRPTANAGLDIEITKGEQAELLGTGSGGTGLLDYNWKPESLIIDPNIANATTINLYNDFNFILQVNDENGCSSLEDTTRVRTTGSTLDLNIVAIPENICNSSYVELHALPIGGMEEYSISWVSDPPGFYSMDFVVNAIITENTRFIATLEDGIDQIERSIMVHMNDNPQVYKTEGSGYFCDGSDGSQITLSDSEENITYYLQEDGFSNGISLEGTGDSLKFNNLTKEKDYTILAVNTITGCSNLMNGAIEIERVSVPESFGIQGGGEFCEGEEGVDFILTSSEHGIDYQLYYQGNPIGVPESGNGGSITFTDHAYNGSYTIRAFDPITGCKSEMRGIIELDINPLPYVYAGDDETIYLGNSITLEAQGDGFFLWTLPDGGTSENPLNVSPEENSEYIVTATNIYECKSTDTVMVIVNQNIEPIANAFTPNGDNINDKFMEGCELIIYNRWGMELYRGNEGWDGRYKGKYVAAGTYYFVRTTDKGGNEINPVKGSVTVIAPGEL